MILELLMYNYLTNTVIIIYCSEIQIVLQNFLQTPDVVNDY